MVYVSPSLAHERQTDLELFWDECIRTETRINNAIYLIGTFYNPNRISSMF